MIDIFSDAKYGGKIDVKNHIPYLITAQDISPESLLTGRHYPGIVEMAAKKVFVPMDKYYFSHAVKLRTKFTEDSTKSKPSFFMHDLVSG